MRSRGIFGSAVESATFVDIATDRLTVGCIRGLVGLAKDVEVSVQNVVVTSVSGFVCECT